MTGVNQEERGQEPNRKFRHLERLPKTGIGYRHSLSNKIPLGKKNYGSGILYDINIPNEFIFHSMHVFV